MNLEQAKGVVNGETLIHCPDPSKDEKIPVRVVRRLFPKGFAVEAENPFTQGWIEVPLEHLHFPFTAITGKKANNLIVNELLWVDPTCGHSAAGCRVRIKQPMTDGGRVICENLTTGRTCVVFPNELGTLHKDLKPIKLRANSDEAPQGWYVFNPNHGAPRVVHSTHKAAREEAMRIAEISGDTVMVLRIDGVAKSVTRTVTETSFISEDGCEWKS